MVSIRTERPSVSDTGTHGNHEPIGQGWNDGYIYNTQ